MSERPLYPGPGASPLRVAASDVGEAPPAPFAPPPLVDVADPRRLRVWHLVRTGARPA